MSRSGEHIALLIYTDSGEPLEIPCPKVELFGWNPQIADDDVSYMLSGMLAIRGQQPHDVVVDTETHDFCVGQEIPLGDGTLAEIRGVWCNGELDDRYQYIKGLENIYASGFLTHMAQEAGVVAPNEPYPIRGRLLLFVERTDRKASQSTYMDAFSTAMSANADSIEDAIQAILKSTMNLSSDELKATMKEIKGLESTDDVEQFLSELEKRIK